MSDSFRLILMRHGHSPMNARSDQMRRLSERGLAQVAYTGQRLAEWPERWHPKRVWVSSAQRTQQTHQRLAQVWSALGHVDPIIQDELYLADTERWRLTLDQEEAPCVLCVGHNPGLSDLVGQLCGEWVNLEVGEAVGLRVQGQESWTEALKARWELRGRVRPTIQA